MSPYTLSTSIWACAPLALLACQARSGGAAGPATPTDAGTTDAGDAGLPPGAAEISDLSDAQLEQALIERLRSCGLVSGEGTVHFQRVRYPGERCVAACVLGQACDVLGQVVCQGAEVGPLNACVEACGQRERRLACAAEPRTYNESFTCDGQTDCCGPGSRDCADLTDETDCALFECADGVERVPAHFQCDGLPDCRDGSDERARCADWC